MKNKNQNRPSNEEANYNPTNRNFDQSDVSGKPESINNVHEQWNTSEQHNRTEDTDPPLTEQDLEETGMSAEDADKIEWEPPRESESRNDDRKERNNGPSQ
jgi:hypothetical protein